MPTKSLQEICDSGHFCVGHANTVSYDVPRIMPGMAHFELKTLFCLNYSKTTSFASLPERPVLSGLTVTVY